MTEQEVRDALKVYGWSFLRRERRRRSYVYAARKMHGKREEVYIGSLANLTQLTLDQLRAKLGVVALSETDWRIASAPLVPLTKRLEGIRA
jgi:ORF D-335-like protein